MRFVFFLADHVFRFRYRNPNIESSTWDIGIYEEEHDKMLRDFFFMGLVIGAVLSAIIEGVLWLM